MQWEEAIEDQLGRAVIPQLDRMAGDDQKLVLRGLQVIPDRRRVHHSPTAPYQAGPGPVSGGASIGAERSKSADLLGKIDMYH
jgi:hypothetical protein